MTEEQILARLQERPDLLSRLKAGDTSTLPEIFELGLATKVIRHSVECQYCEDDQ